MGWLFLAYVIAEFLAFVLVASWLGFLTALLLILIAIPIGLAIIGKASRTRPLWFLSGMLIAVPGFLTDIAGLILLLPPVQQAIMRKGRTWLDANVTFLDFEQVQYGRSVYDVGDVVQGVVIDERDEPGANPGHGPGHDDGPPKGAIEGS